MKKFFIKKKWIIIIAIIALILGTFGVGYGTLVVNHDDKKEAAREREIAVNHRLATIMQYLDEDNKISPVMFFKQYFTGEESRIKLINGHDIMYDSIPNDYEKQGYDIYTCVVKLTMDGLVVTGDENDAKRLLGEYYVEPYRDRENWLNNNFRLGTNATFVVDIAIKMKIIPKYYESLTFNHIIDKWGKLPVKFIIFGAILIAIGLFYLVGVLVFSPHREYESVLKLGRWYDTFSSGIAILITIATAIIGIIVINNNYLYGIKNLTGDIEGHFIKIAIVIFIMSILIVWNSLSIARRAYRGSLVSDSRLLTFVTSIWNKLSEVVQVVISTIALLGIFVGCIILANNNHLVGGLIIAVLVGIIAMLLVLYAVKKYHNKMQFIIDKSVKDERTKAELIANVSHDIKTPLTSVVNYIGLLQKDNVKKEQQKEYLEVLNRQSLRMKKLIEDLIEASKAATHNLEMNIMDCNVGTLLDQSIAEYELQTADKNLKVIKTIPDKDIMVSADGQRLFRVFDNLFSNACKYSLEGSRIFVAVKEINDKVQIEIRNTCKELPQISVDELTERFVRGDLSRTSEGSGLGLAIAKDLMELMEGSLKLGIENDVFIVTLVLKAVVLDA